MGATAAAVAEWWVAGEAGAAVAGGSGAAATVGGTSAGAALAGEGAVVAGGSGLGAVGSAAVTAAASAAVSSALAPNPKTPEGRQVIGMPDAKAQAEARRRSLAEQMTRSGRASTILTDSGNKLGG